MKRTLQAWSLAFLLLSAFLGNTSLAGVLLCRLQYYEITDTNVTAKIENYKRPFDKEYTRLSKQARLMPSGSEKDKVFDQISSHCEKSQQFILSLLDKQKPTATHTFNAPTTGRAFKEKTSLAGKPLEIFVKTRPGVYLAQDGTTLGVDLRYSFRFDEDYTAETGAAWSNGDQFVLFSYNGYMTLDIKVSQ